METNEELDTTTSGIKDFESRPFASIVVPAYNEAAIIEDNLRILCRYMESLSHKYKWEIIVVNDGSQDGTGDLAEKVARSNSKMRVLHHFTNFNVGQALRYAFSNCHGDYIVVMDADLSYSPDHIERLLDEIINTKARIVLASPYMKGGKISNVPFLRKFFSISANKFLSMTSKGNFSTLTGMVRAYDAKFIKSLCLKSMDVSISAEIIYKAMLLKARIVEIPAHLDWSALNAPNLKRKSSIKLKRSVMAYMLAGFIFKPFIFFILPAFALGLISVYSFFWVFAHTFSFLARMPVGSGTFDVRFSAAVSSAYQLAPHTFIIGGISLVLAIQLFSLGVISLQNKKYFEELYHLGTTIFKGNLADFRQDKWN